MRRVHVKLPTPLIQRDMDMLAYGHAGLPVLVFPSSEGKFFEYEDFKMVEAVAHHIEAGLLRLYCIDSYDSDSWYGRHRPPHERAWRHTLYEYWVMKTVVPAIAADVNDPNVTLTTTGCSFGAFHSALFALKFPERFPHALCMSGVYDIRFLLDGHHDDNVYFNNPMEFVTHAHGQELDRLRSHAFVTLVAGQGPWEDKSLESTREFWHLLSRKQIPNYMDLWGHDVAHDWPWWRKQIVFYMDQLVHGRHPWLPT